jgi:hypothetical protein
MIVANPELLAIKNADVVPQLSLDCVIFGFSAGQLKVLLVKWRGTVYWSLPGGLVRQTESLEDAATRILTQRTGLENIFLRQFYTFGDIPRYDKQVVSDRLSALIPVSMWYDRAISVGYYALVDFAKVHPTADELSDSCDWKDLDEVPELLFDHSVILKTALDYLRKAIVYQPVGLNLLPDKFTMPEMMRLYEAILGRKIDPRNFQKKILKSGVVTKCDEVRKGTAHRSPYLYSFDRVRYEEVLQSGGLFFI